MRGVPTVFEAHTLTSLQGPQERWVLRRLARAPGFRGIVAISAALADDLAQHLGVPRARIHVAHDGVRLLPGSLDTPDAPGAPLRVGYTGSLYPGKGGEMLLPLAAACPWAEFTVAGGPQDLSEALRESAATAGVDNLTVVGPVDPVEARALQQRCDVLIAPFSRRIESDSGVDIARWTSPMKVFEYMASGRPIVISDLPVLREVLRPDVDALMVEPEDPEALIGALRRLADDPALGERLAASALERARTEFTWEARALGILERFVPEAHRPSSTPTSADDA
jgi:glycosyltransferase involved in cell wall biosynthesis